MNYPVIFCTGAGMSGSLGLGADHLSELGLRGLGQIATVGFSQGAPFAFALAGSGAAHAVAIAAGQDDMLSVRHLLHPDAAAMVDGAARDPARFERDIAETASAEWLWRTINDMIAEPDRKLYTTGRFARTYRRSASPAAR